MPAVNLTDRVKEVADTWNDAGRNVSETARRLGVTRPTVQSTLEVAASHGYIQKSDLHEANTPNRNEYEAARLRKIAAYQTKKRKGDWRKAVLTKLAPEPYRLKIFGDPHIDNDGCNFELFERHWLEMSSEDRIYGICVGDFFDNWTKSLAHLFKEHSTPPSDAWTLFEYLMEQRGEALIAACSGNHDDWSHGPVDPVDLLMKRYGVLYRQGAIRVAVHHEGCDPMHWSIRHKWKGQSMYSAAHWGAAHGNVKWRDPLMVGGHIHQDDTRLVQKDDGTWCHVCQVSAFKEFDSYADTHGFTGTKISPVWDLVIDPRRKQTDPERIKVFWDSEAAKQYHEAIA